LNHAKPYPTAEAALDSKRGRAGGAEAYECPGAPECGPIHLRPARRPTPARRPARDTGPTAAVRATVLARDGWSCARCGVSILSRPYSLQHRLRRSHGGGSLPSNLVVLCGTATTDCHRAVDNYKDPDDGPDGKGYRVDSAGDPRLIPVMYFSPGGCGYTRWLADNGDLLEACPGPEVAA
jgi:5-methylcytosine-specific restriction endonuclease McrA